MTVFKCDRCGKTYNIPVARGNNKPNHVELLLKTKNNEHRDSNFDLCPSCMSTLWAYLMGKENLIFRGE